ncbi:hypothetical protein THAOC_28649, partial [Thalassiosira oceanica]
MTSRRSWAVGRRGRCGTLDLREGRSPYHLAFRISHSFSDHGGRERSAAAPGEVPKDPSPPQGRRGPHRRGGGRPASRLGREGAPREQPRRRLAPDRRFHGPGRPRLHHDHRRRHRNAPVGPASGVRASLHLEARRGRRPPEHTHVRLPGGGAGQRQHGGEGLHHDAAEGRRRGAAGDGGGEDGEEEGGEV